MKHLKILGLSLLALVGVMAVSASGAQAKWLILLNKASVKSVEVKVKTTEGGHLLVPGLGLDIHCTTGEGTINASLSSEDKTLSGSGIVDFKGCDDAGEFGLTCDVRSVGKATGTITASGSGVASMEGEKDFINLESSGASPFTNVEYIGSECPLTEIDGRVFGSVKVEVLEPLADLTLHLGHVVAQKLTFGEEPATLENETKQGPLVSITDVNAAATLGLHLVGL